MNNPLRILSELDNHLHQEVELNVYGRAAIALGFDPGPPFSATLDVDLIIPEVQLEAMDANEDFWLAVENVNVVLAAENLYLTHVFVDRQLILRQNWLTHRVPLELSGLRHIRAYRPCVADLLLTKTMRVDPQDRSDIRLLASREPLPRSEWEKVFQDARVPDIPEIMEAFQMNRNWFFEEVAG
ncbi:MAG: hypothetical protein ACO3N7_01765 [Kiritimatiellia bacterium]